MEKHEVHAEEGNTSDFHSKTKTGNYRKPRADAGALHMGNHDLLAHGKP